MSDAPKPRAVTWSNRVVGWCSLAAGAITGLVLGLWSFDGPVPVPEVLGAYDQTGRRLARLGHIAFFGLGILNILLATELLELRLTDGARRLASRAMNFGNIFLPLTLFAAALFRPLKYAMSLPATAVAIAMVVVAAGIVAGPAAPDTAPGREAR